MNHNFPKQTPESGHAYAIETCTACGFITRRYTGGVRTFQSADGPWKAGKMPPCPGPAVQEVLDDLISDEELDAIFGDDNKRPAPRFSARELAKTAPPAKATDNGHVPSRTRKRRDKAFLNIAGGESVVLPAEEVIPYVKKQLADAPRPAIDEDRPSYFGVDTADIKKTLLEKKAALFKELRFCNDMLDLIRQYETSKP